MILITRTVVPYCNKSANLVFTQIYCEPFIFESTVPYSYCNPNTVGKSTDWIPMDGRGYSLVTAGYISEQSYEYRRYSYGTYEKE